MADTTEAPVAGANMRGPARPRPPRPWSGQPASDAFAGQHRTVAAAGRHRGDAIDELGFADERAPPARRRDRTTRTRRRRCFAPCDRPRRPRAAPPAGSGWPGNPTGDGADRRSASSGSRISSRALAPPSTPPSFSGRWRQTAALGRLSLCGSPSRGLHGKPAEAPVEATQPIRELLSAVPPDQW